MRQAHPEATQGASQPPRRLGLGTHQQEALPRRALDRAGEWLDGAAARRESLHMQLGLGHAYLPQQALHVAEIGRWSTEKEVSPRVLAHQLGHILQTQPSLVPRLAYN